LQSKHWSLLPDHRIQQAISPCIPRLYAKNNPQFMANFVAANEMFWGLLLLIGLFTRLSSFALIVIILVALVTKDIHSIPTELVPIDPKIGVHPIENYTWLTYFLYLPQVLYLMLLGLFSLYGYKYLGIDHFLKKKKKLYR